MKNKKPVTLILLFLCVIIWGTIGWKVYSAFQENDVVIVQPTKKNATAEKKDTLHLLLNYRDPFLGEYSDSAMKEEDDTIYPVALEGVEDEPAIEISPDFRYKGIIRLGKNTQAMVQWNGKSLMFKTKDKVGEFTITQITEEKLIVSRKNKKYELPIQ